MFVWGGGVIDWNLIDEEVRIVVTGEAGVGCERLHEREVGFLGFGLIVG